MIANLNTLAFDFIVKRKLGGINFSHFIIKQLPVILPSKYDLNLLTFVVPSAFELTYTAWDIKAFADDLWREADEPLRATLKQQWDENFAETFLLRLTLSNLKHCLIKSRPIVV